MTDLPLLLETGAQARFLIPWVILLAFGLAVATLMSLIVVRVIYTILDDFSLTQHEEGKGDAIAAC